MWSKLESRWNLDTLSTGSDHLTRQNVTWLTQLTWPLIWWLYLIKVCFITCLSILGGTLRIFGEFHPVANSFDTLLANEGRSVILIDVKSCNVTGCFKLFHCYTCSVADNNEYRITRVRNEWSANNTTTRFFQ